MASKGLIVTSLVILALGYWLYSPLPEGISEPWKVRIIMANLKIMNVFTTVGEKLGLDSKLNLTRRATEFFLSMNPRDDRVDATDTTFDGVKVRIYRPKSEPNTILPAVVYYHGGGWTALSVNCYDSMTSYIAAEANIVVVSVDYRLAPEHPFPIPFDDCVIATVHLLRNAKNYKVDPRRIGIAGDGAGGNLAAAVANRLSFEVRLPPILYHILLYPALQSFDFNTPSYVTNNHVMEDMINKEAAARYWMWYYQGNLNDIDKVLVNNHTSSLLKVSKYSEYVSHEMLPEIHRLSERQRMDFGDEAFSQKFERFLLNGYANPLMVDDLSILPPVYLVTIESSVYRDDGLLYKKRLEDYGVPYTHKHYQNGFQGFFTLFNSLLEPHISRDATNELVNFVRTELELPQ